MWLRWVVSNLANQVAEDKMRRVVESARRVVQPRRPTGTSAAAVPEQQEPCNLVILFASEMEAGGMIDRLTDSVMTECPTFREYVGRLAGRRVVVAYSGMGREATLRATDDVFAVHRPQWLISAGFAGALTPDLRRGQIVLVNEVCDEQGKEVRIGLESRTDDVAGTPNLHQGRLVTVAGPVVEVARKEQLAAQFRAIVCDMETMAVAQVCQRRKVTLLGIRVITDELEERIPPEVERFLHHDSFAGKLGVVAGSLFRRPGSMKDMWRLREAAVKASDRLARFLEGVVAQLPAGSSTEE